TTAGAFTVTASVTGVSTPASGTFTNLPGPVTTLKFTAEPTGTTAGATITPPVVIQALDIYNNPVSGVTIAVAAQGGREISPGPSRPSRVQVVWLASPI